MKSYVIERGYVRLGTLLEEFFGIMLIIILFMTQNISNYFCNS